MTNGTGGAATEAPPAPASPATTASAHGDSRARGKAYLELCDIKTSHGATTTGGPGKKIEFQFNPKEFSVSKSANWNETVTHTQTDVEYLGPSPSTMSLTMFLDGSEKGTDVSKQVQELINACMPTDASTSKNRPLPPGVRFGWDKVYFEGYLQKVEARYTLFKRDGVPIRAVCTLSIAEFAHVALRQNPTSGAISSHRSYEVVDGDTLASIANKEYGHAAHWRGIAAANRIDDPLRLRPGTKLLIPPPEQAAEAS